MEAANTSAHAIRLSPKPRLNYLIFNLSSMFRPFCLKPSKSRLQNLGLYRATLKQILGLHGQDPSSLLAPEPLL